MLGLIVGECCMFGVIVMCYGDDYFFVWDEIFVFEVEVIIYEFGVVWCCVIFVDF